MRKLTLNILGREKFVRERYGALDMKSAGISL